MMEEIRPIDANALKKTLHNFFDGKVIDEPTYILRDIFCHIDNAPTILLPDFKDGYKQAIIDGKTNFSSSHTDEKCKTCKYYLYGFESYPCAHCQRNFKLADEIREQQNDFWKDGTPK